MNILFVCTGNTCRSPMAEGYLKHRLPSISVRSRGLSADGSPASQNSITAMKEKGIDISSHLSQPLNTGDIVWADKILCMSPSHKAALAMFADSKKLFVLGNGISDPYGGNENIYSSCRDQIFSAIDSLEADGFFSEFYICTLEQTHIKQIAKLEKICFSAPWSEDVILDSFIKGTKFFVAAEGDKVLGYIGISCVLDEGYIANIAVCPEHRKKGIATALIERVFSHAKDNLISFVSLEVRASNKGAIALYEKTGFKTEGRRKGFYRNPTEDALIMTKRFDL